MILLDGLLRIGTYVLRFFIFVLLLRTLSNQSFVQYSAVASIVYVSSFLIGFDRGGLFSKYISKKSPIERAELVISMNIFLFLVFIIIAPVALVKISTIQPEISFTSIAIVILLETLFIENRKLLLGGSSFRLAFWYDLLKSFLMILGLTFCYYLSVVSIDNVYTIWMLTNIIIVSLILKDNKSMSFGALSLRSIVNGTFDRLNDGVALYFSSGVLLLAESFGRIVLSSGDPLAAVAFTVASSLTFIPYVLAWSFFIAPGYPQLIGKTAENQVLGLAKLFQKGTLFLFCCQLAGFFLVEPFALLLKPDLTGKIQEVYTSLILLPFVQYAHNLIMLRWQLLGLYKAIAIISCINITIFGVLYFLVDCWTIDQVVVVLYAVFLVSSLRFLADKADIRVFN